MSENTKNSKYAADIYKLIDFDIDLSSIIKNAHEEIFDNASLDGSKVEYPGNRILEAALEFLASDKQEYGVWKKELDNKWGSLMSRNYRMESEEAIERYVVLENLAVKNDLIPPDFFD